MSKDYDILFNRYNRLKARVKDLEEQLNQKQQQWSERDSETALTNRMVRELCEDILSRAKQNTEKQSSWRTMPINSLVTEAQKGFASYSVSNREMLSNVLKTSEDRRIHIEGLELQIEAMLKNPGNTTITPEELQAQLEKDRKLEEALKKVPPAIRDSVAAGISELELDDDDTAEDLEKEMLEASAAISHKAQLTPKSIPRTESRKHADAVKKIKDDAAVKPYLENLNEYKAKLKPLDWDVISVMGKTGISILAMLFPEVMKRNMEYKESSIRTSVNKLVNMQLVSKENVRTPLRGSYTLVMLKEKGKILYKDQYKKDAVRSEMERVITEHDNTTHGYGILEIEEELKSKEYYKSVRIWNRKNPIRLDSGSEVIPDIICVDTNDSKMYIEYETGGHHQTDFSAKCSKLCRISFLINVITPNEPALDKVKDQAEKWMETKGHALDRYTIRLTTSVAVKSKDLRKNNGWKYVYHPEKGTKPEVNY